MDKNNWRLQYHLMPPEGWLNDPNGLCQFDGIYHVFFQYSPNEPGPDGRKARTWGHYAGPDLLHLKFEGVPFWPVDRDDYNGCYSGSALLPDDGEDKLRLYYTGNVKEPGDHDYTYSGRQANEILVEMDREGNFGKKQVVLRNSDYPDNCTCHVRDPKVWKEDGKYYMVLGARVAGPDKKPETDYGEVLLYSSKDGLKWDFEKTMNSDTRFGYMWECPDYFELDGETFLGICPQGVPSEEFRYQNIYESGYWRVDGKLSSDQKLHDFREWDMGFDFYAPQTFVDDSYRRILIGWVGMPDAPYKNATAECDPYWENCLTVPRELTAVNGIICQKPVEELNELRTNRTNFESEGKIAFDRGAGDIEIRFTAPESEKKWTIAFGSDVLLKYNGGVLFLTLSESAGCGRTVRKLKADQINDLRILVDTSIIEIYVNGGEYVMTSRFYPDYDPDAPALETAFLCPKAEISCWDMKTIPANAVHVRHSRAIR
ncbi:MAG: sucrose-6-phosphate hydrolase [Eubacteriales bacterium]|jgi:beta-fructofuranosidase